MTSRSNNALRAPPSPDRSAVIIPEIAGRSERIRRLREEIVAVAPIDSTVLLTGPTGCGKGRAARALHRLSRRARRAFIHVDCASLSPGIIESELFGHEQGAFTGAGVRRRGRFELAGEGTVFLDEVGDLDLSLQSKLLRVLEDREYERVGGSETLSMRARVIAATNRNLLLAVHQQRFRADLYYRLNVIQLRVPALVERIDDLPLLVRDGLAQVARKLGLESPRPSDALLERLSAHSWPGNVRELLNLLERLTVLHAGATLDGSHAARLLEEVDRARSETPSQSTPRTEDSETEMRTEIAAALARSAGNVAGAARYLRIPRSTLRHRMRRLELDTSRNPPRVSREAGP